MALRIDRIDYQPGSRLDTELADLCYQAIHGRTDQRPITIDLVASRLSASTSQSPTALITIRDEHGLLIGAVALRWPYVPTGTGRLWGPVVHPGHRGHRLGDRLLTAICGLDGEASALPALTTAEIPSAARGAHALFTRARWRRLPSLTLLRGPVPPPGGASPRPSAVWTAQDSTLIHLAPHLGRLYADTYRDHDPRTAADTLRRWSQDRRYQADRLLLAGPVHQPIAAALLYPLASDHSGEPAELLIADILTDQSLTVADQRTACSDLVHAALLHGTYLGSAVARAVLPSHRELCLTVLENAGLKHVDDFTLYTHLR
ncbi:hypothetical protein ACG83_40270 [Frankia sp. R43]|uniref:GNAT family N-acetyltransferase n=1 Tax=Frankia sp. R43 TaxID=269536 RepID=UPI0006CA5D4B|nr:GNAT family N-acetyltransferase [Frankia sp. R43]KPM50374.1 hypothetical protein ACG83_40270 [Frankia sp. R43]